ncbi:MAG: lipid A biosynthesis acyltransferase [Gammaproteobacteria bacterium HGW-Gammaproteobacteria-1]|jgi:predicted LPLAT superfamily acyltransferase|nr:MAG: lipid A biosynthesis acyltransferase [Gammaproteobacteria bacterium HGW-Gammaproteobacteria-1]
MAAGWQGQSERGSPWALRLILWIALHIGRGAARVLLYPITFYFLLNGRTARNASRDYLTRIFGRAPTLAERIRHIHCFAATILDRVYFLSGQFDRFDVRLHGVEVIQARAGTGALLLSAHVGSFDALRALGVEQRGLPIKVLMFPDHNGFITALLHTLNPALLETIIPLGGIDTLLRVQEAVTQGEMVGMLGDRVAAGGKTVSCDFLGAPAPFPVGPAQLAAVLRVPVILVFGLYRGGNRYDLYFETFDAVLPQGRREREAALGQWTQAYAARLEHHVRIAPYNWFNFYDFWPQD